VWYRPSDFLDIACMLLGGAEGQDIGPTTACFDCGAVISVGDCFYSGTRDQWALCEGCYTKAERAGRARCSNQQLQY